MGVTLEPDEAAQFSAADSLFGRMRPALREGSPVEITHASLGALRVWPREAVYAATTESLASLCGDQAGAYRLRRLQGAEPPADASARPLEELLWTAGFAGSAGRLVDGLDPTDLVELTQWPNLTRVPIEAHGMRLAALFRRYPSSIPLAARRTGAGREEVHRFLSAAWCAGLARAVNRPDAETAVEPAAADGGRADNVIEALLRRLWG